MKHLPKHLNIMTLKDTFEDVRAIRILMELCKGGELFDWIVARGSMRERGVERFRFHFYLKESERSKRNPHKREKRGWSLIPCRARERER